MPLQLITSNDVSIPKNVSTEIKKFLKSIQILECDGDSDLIVMQDEKSDAFYVICHTDAQTLTDLSDLDAVLNPDEDDEYKLNRDIYTNEPAYKIMESDALAGRSFEDIVVEFDRSYKSKKPLKVYGGQHRITAIKEALNEGINNQHGIRVYFDLSTEQRLDIATVNNTSIGISNDLLDRMQEDYLGTELRDFCQDVGLLDDGVNFSDKRTQAGIPTVRIIRTLLINYYKGKQASRTDFHSPIIAKSGGLDKEYQKIREDIDWGDEDLCEMGAHFAELHNKQMEVVNNRNENKSREFAIKAIHPCVVAAWGYASGYFQKYNKSKLGEHYGLPNKVKGNKDPLNAFVLLNARLKGVDKDSYRGLGSRQTPEELGRMLEVFFIHADKAPPNGITNELAQAAIKSYTAKKAKHDADKSLEKI